MNNLLKSISLTFLLGLISLFLSAQEKNQSYYRQHEKEIIKDATGEFKNGNYERTIELCRWHSEIVRNHAADALLDLSKRCAQLSAEMANFRISGRTKEATERAETLLSLNPNDPSAKVFLNIMEEPESPAPADTLMAEEPVPSIPDARSTFRKKSSSPETMFVLKAAGFVLVLDYASDSTVPGGSFGFYNLGGSRFGLETGGYFHPDVLSAISLIGFDASLVLRISKSVYPKIGVGYFSYTERGRNTATHGLCAGGGMTFLLGRHFCLEVGARYFPEMSVHNNETVMTAPGVTYDFSSVKQLLSGGIAPVVSVGFAF